MTMLEELARAVHGALSRADVMRYLDMPSDTADQVAQAILPITTREIDRAKAEGWNAAVEKAAGIANHKAAQAEFSFSKAVEIRHAEHQTHYAARHREASDIATAIQALKDKHDDA